MALHSLSLTPPSLLRASKQSPFGELKRFGLSFSNPVGLAAGFDKDGIALQSLAALGFGFIEAGTVTLQAQPGNERPRLFRLPKDKALINRAGFNNHGAASFARRVLGHEPDCVLGVSIGKSKSAPIEEAVQDYRQSFELVYDVADYIAVNISSPNTPRLRELQHANLLRELLQALQQQNRELAQDESKTKPLLVKLSPDLHEKDLENIVEVCMSNAVAGIIATNTTVTRNGLNTSAGEVNKYGQGGLSGAPLRKMSTETLAKLYRLSEGKIPLVGVGGIFSAQDAWEKICAGASLVQLYTGLIYEGPGIVRSINEGLHRILLQKGFSSLDDAVGSSAKEV